MFEQEECDFSLAESNDDLLSNDSNFSLINTDYNKLEYLSNVDYSLNSPLIPDEIEEFIKFLRGQPFRQGWNLKVWNIRKNAASIVNFNFNDVVQPNQFHSWFAGKNLQTNFYVKSIQSLLVTSQADSDLTFPIVSTFIKQWINKDVDNPNKSRVPQKILKWGAYFLDLHVMTLCLNAIDDKEREELIKLQGVRYLNINHKEDLVFESRNFGKVLISAGFIFLLHDNVIMDRNTLLMVKDTCIARFQTLLSMINRSDELFTHNDWEVMFDVYQMGDRLMLYHGNDSYEGLKMIEPFSVHRLADLAHEFRPLIPKFTDFLQHINQSLIDLFQKNIDMYPIFNSLNQIDNPDMVLTIFGSFRHWGHPYIQYLDGLETVHEQVTMPKEIDNNYAEALASDLAYIVLKSKFDSHKKWYVDATKLDEKCPLHSHIKSNTWPTPKQIQDFGDNWHNLPLIQCYDIPDVIDPSIIYADKSHSMNKSEVLKHIMLHPNTPIPSKKVLDTFINSPATNWKEFLQEINDIGLTEEDLTIGLKVKEREVKIKGRFFTLMSWRLREYFVVTEYLIKQHFVPLFKGLTMADDLNTVIKKLMDNSTGQGQDDYETICIANHIDYTKWNNHQRQESNGPVFTVMGKFLGYPNLINRTHEFFQKSFIYYNGRPDLISVNDGIPSNRTDKIVCWNGQAGGLEGLRQKGWSVVNLLVIRRESIIRNTKIKILAQGDNQVICTQYKVQKTRNDNELRQCLDNIVLNNNAIMKSIEDGTGKLGLIINRDEGIQSADFLIYGKVPIFRGNIKGIESKRWSRVTCVTNDQLPTLANTLSTINSNALTVSHFSNSPINSMIHYNFLGNFSLNLLDIHNPALKGSPKYALPNYEKTLTRGYKSLVLYLDPCLGGACGMSLTRFLIRNFPDPVTESLTFWKCIGESGPSWIRNLAGSVGNPKISSVNLQAFKRLLEDPLSLNIPGGTNPLTMIKEEIRKSLIISSHKIKNEIVRSSIEYLNSQEDTLVNFLRSIRPLFPRFLSEYCSGTYIGIVKSLINLFQNSKTIRNVFSRKLDSKVKKIIVQSEIYTMTSLISLSEKRFPAPIWKCSSEKADSLRHQSWGQKVYGATIPHPLELINIINQIELPCIGCQASPPTSYYISTLVPHGLSEYQTKRGPYKAYLGSRTSENTSILQPWEKDSSVPLIRRALKLRNAIGWFIDKDSYLASTILQNLQSLTGEDWSGQVEGFKRTGSALHRFASSRQSSSGYAARSPSKLTWMCSTTDTLSTLNQINYDFMHQTLLLYSQTSVAEIMDHIPHQGYFHSHINCISCLREIEEISLDTTVAFQHIETFEKLSKWKPDSTKWSERRSVRQVKIGKWERLSSRQQSYHIGRAEGFLYADMSLGGDSRAEDMSLFPLSIQNKVIPSSYLEGILNGIIRGSSIHCVSRRAISEIKRPREALLGIALHIIDRISLNPAMITLWRSPNFEDLFMTIPHKIPYSYPLSNQELGGLGRNFLRTTYRTQYLQGFYEPNDLSTIWIFADVNEPSFIGLLCLSSGLTSTLYSQSFSAKQKSLIREYKNGIIYYKDPKTETELISQDKVKILRTDREIRHACKEIQYRSLEDSSKFQTWGKECTSKVYFYPIYFNSVNIENGDLILDCPRIQNPLISGLRLFQFATGSHYKINSILNEGNIRFQDAIIGGDGSGGISSLLLRLNPMSRVIFNSLLTLNNVDLRGTTPSPPSAISALIPHRNRCVNLYDAWENPSDLTCDNTWTYFSKLVKDHDLHIDLIIIDAEPSCNIVRQKIEDKIKTHIHNLLVPEGNLIYKTYLDKFTRNEDNVLNNIGPLFENVSMCWCDFSSSQTSEVYLIFKGAIKTNRDLSLDVDHFSQNCLEFPCFHTEEKEFKRALYLQNLDLMKGVPPNLINDPFDEFIDNLQSLGVETGIAAIIAETLRLTTPDNLCILLHAVFFVSSNQLLNLTRFDEYKPRPPSDGTVYSLGVLWVSYLNWISIITKDVRLHKSAQFFLNQGFPFSWYYRKVIKNEEFKPQNLFKDEKSKLKKLGQIYVRHYSLSNQYKNKKNFYLDSHMARIGRLERSLFRICQIGNNDWDLNVLNKLMRGFNNRLNTFLIGRRTDFFTILKGELKVSEIQFDMVTTAIEQEEEMEGAYVS